jgi:hypothetical protein
MVLFLLGRDVFESLVSYFLANEGLERKAVHLDALRASCVGTRPSLSLSSCGHSCGGAEKLISTQHRSLIGAAGLVQMRHKKNPVF